MNLLIQGLIQHDQMPLQSIFGKDTVNKIERTKAVKTVDSRRLYKASQEQLSLLSSKQYQKTEQFKEAQIVLFANQIMQQNVKTLLPDMSIVQANRLFKDSTFHELPVVSLNGEVMGMISDRDILEYMAGSNEKNNNISDRVEQLMTSPVITATLQTELLYIARLFIEKHINAIPIVDEGKLKGIITRRDLLHSIIKHYEIDFWV